MVKQQAESMAGHDFNVTILTSRTGVDRDDYLLNQHVKVVRVPAWHIFEKRYFIPFPLFSPSLAVVAWLEIRKADVVHIHDVFYISSWVAALVAVCAKKPILLTQHVGLVEHASHLVVWAQKKVYESFGKWIFSRAKTIIAYNDNVREFLSEYEVPNNKILLMRNGVDTTFFRPSIGNERCLLRERYGLPQERPLVLFVGRLVEKKGVQILRDAKDRAFDLVFVGPGPVSQHWKTEGVHWLGPLGQSEIAELYRACDLFAFPATGEIFTLVMQEAMASGLPVITTNDPAYTGTEAEDVLTLCPRSPVQFKKAIMELLSSPERRVYLSKLSRAVALKNFDWNCNFNRLMDFYENIAS